MSIINAAETKVTYHVSIDQLKALIVADLGVPADIVSVTPQIEDKRDDYFDAYPSSSTPVLTGLKVVVTHSVDTITANK